MKYFLLLCSVALSLVVLSGCDSTSNAPAPTATTTSSPANAATAFPKEEAEKLINRLATQDGCKDSTADMRLSFTDAEGKPQQMNFRLQRKYEAGKVSTLMTVLSPPEESEKALLALEEDGKPTSAISYLAGLKKVAQLKSDNPLNFRGSKSTVQEMLGMELNQYEVKSVSEIKAANPYSFRITLQEKSGMNLIAHRIDVSMSSKTTAHALDEKGNLKGLPADFSADLFELYDSKDQLLKRMKVIERKWVRTSQDKSYPTFITLEIEDAQRNQKLKLETRNIKYDTNLAPSLFTEANLIKNVTAASQKQIQ